MVIFGYIIFFCYYTIYNLQAKITQFGQNGVFQNEPTNIFLKENSDIKVEFDLSDDNYEYISEYYTISLRPKKEDKSLRKFNGIVSREYERAMQSNRARANDKGTTQKTSIMELMKKNNSSIKTSHGRLIQTRKSNITDEKVEYDYLVSDIGVKGDATYSSVETELIDLGRLNSMNKITYNCTKQELNNASVNFIKRLVEEFYKKQDYNTLAKHAWKIAAVWVVVYLVIAVPLWFTRGWCSCCLYCKIFKPQETIQEAKNYLLLNPPGILVTKRGGIVHYEPTEREKDCYEEFGHFLRIL